MNHQTNQKVLIMATPLYHKEGDYSKILRDAGLEPVFPPECKPGVSEEELATWLSDRSIVAVLAGGEPYTRRVIEAAPGLRIISRAGVGTDSVDIQAATERGVFVTITPGANHEAVAEHTFALLLSLSRQILKRDHEVRRGIWNRNPLLPLRGKTLGVVGMGRIGRAVIQRAHAFGMRILVTEEYPDPEFLERFEAELVSLEELLARSDYVTLHVPLTERTRHMINRRTIALMKQGAILVNTARGGLVCESDLIEALRSGQLGGAGLDVFEQEPLPTDSPLAQMENVVLAPHVAGIDERSMYEMAVGAARNIVNVLHMNLDPEVIVNKELLPAI